jgi:undecaprenyl-diphosphatase
VFAWISYTVLVEKDDSIDLYLLDVVTVKLDSTGLTSFMQKLTFFGSATFLKIGYCVVMVPFFAAGKYRRVVEIFVVGAGSFLMSDLLKLAFHRARPLHSLIGQAAQFSYPSGHAMSGFIFYALVAYLLYRSRSPRFLKIAFSVLLLLFALLIGFSRVYLRVHFPSDVLAGFCLGAAWLILVLWLFQQFNQSRVKPRSAR